MKKTIVLSALFTLSLPFAQVSAAETAPTYRYAGENRFDTSVAIADEWVESDVAVLATGRNYPDALSASALAAGLFNGVILTDPNEPKTTTKETVQFYFVGGEKALPDSTIAKLFQY